MRSSKLLPTVTMTERIWDLTLKNIYMIRNVNSRNVFIHFGSTLSQLFNSDILSEFNLLKFMFSIKKITKIKNELVACQMNYQIFLLLIWNSGLLITLWTLLISKLRSLINEVWSITLRLRRFKIMIISKTNVGFILLRLV